MEALHEFFTTEFPDMYKSLAVSILFIPSVVFWGSGLMKDSITFSAHVIMYLDFTGSLL